MIAKSDSTRFQGFLHTFDREDALIYGIGNVGRQDDGLGWALIDWIEENALLHYPELVRSYQLHLEDADLIHRKHRVLFVDATQKREIDTFSLSKVAPKMDFSFTSHAISVQSIMSVCKQCFDVVPEVYLLEVRGYAWELKIGLTAKASHNLSLAKDAITHQTYPKIDEEES